MSTQKEIAELNEAIAKATSARDSLLQKQEKQEQERVKRPGDVYKNQAGDRTYIASIGGYLRIEEGVFIESLDDYTDCKWTDPVFRYEYLGHSSELFNTETFTREQIKEKFAKMNDSDGDLAKDEAIYAIEYEDVDEFIDNLLDDKHANGEPVE